MSAAFNMRSSFEPPPFTFRFGRYEVFVDGDPDIDDVFAARELVRAYERGDQVDEQVRELAVRLLCELSSPEAIGSIVTAPPEFQRTFLVDVLALVVGGGLARGRKAARAAHEVTRHLSPPAALAGQDGAPRPVITPGAGRPRERRSQRHLKVAGARDGPGGDDPPLLDPALVEQARRQMRGVPSLTFWVDFEGHAQLGAVCLDEGEEQRLRCYIADHSTQTAAAFLDLLETWLAR